LSKLKAAVFLLVGSCWDDVFPGCYTAYADSESVSLLVALL